MAKRRVTRRRKVSFLARAPSGQLKKVKFYATPKIVKRKKRVKKKSWLGI